MPRLVLASQSPARLQLLRNSGVQPEVRVSGVDESGVDAPSVSELVVALAGLKASAVLPTVEGDDDVVLIACDSLLEFDGEGVGKPGGPEAARRLWQRLRGNAGILHTGHSLHVRTAGTWGSASFPVATRVEFADLGDEEIDAYVGSGEPVWVAGGFTIDSLGAAYVSRIEGDHTNVVGLSLPAVRRELMALGVPWHTLWASADDSRE